MLPPWFVLWCSLAVLINAFSSPADRNKQATQMRTNREIALTLNISLSEWGKRFL